MRFVVAESESAEQREERRRTAGRSSGEAYADTLTEIVPGAVCVVVRPAEGGGGRDGIDLMGSDAVLLTGSPLHVYEETPEARRQIEFMRGVFASGTPSFGSCAGLQVAVAAAGGVVGPNRAGHEVGFARRISPTEAGRDHPFLAGRPAAYDALAVHSDHVVRLPEGATHLATNAMTAIQAAEVRQGPGVFWGVQYHPELPLTDIAIAVRRQSRTLVRDGLAVDEAEVDAYAALIDGLGREPERRDLAWRLGVDRQVTDAAMRQTELRNFIEHLVQPTRSLWGRA